MRTYPIITFGSNALEIKDDATFTLNQGGLQSFADLDNLGTGENCDKFATLEPNYWKMDGSYKFIESGKTKAAWVSTDMSDASGDFSGSVPKITITFSSVHSTDKTTIRFCEGSGDWSDNISVGFYDASDSVIYADFFYPTSALLEVSQTISNFKKIEIYIYGTNNAYRYARLNSIDFDEVERFVDTDVRSANLVEEIDPIATTLPYNTLDFTLYSSDGDFSIISPGALFASLKQNEPIDVLEYINGETIYMGRFYLSEWKSTSESTADFSAADAISLLESHVFLGGLYLSPQISIGDLIDDVMTTAGFSYETNGGFISNETLGMLAVSGNCRDALQEVCFYAGAYATCARSKVINIIQKPDLPGSGGNDYYIPSTSQGIEATVELKKLVTGVELSEYEYIEDNTPTGETLFSKTLATGQRTIRFGKASKLPDGLILGGTATYTVLSNRYSYVIINVTSGGTVILTQNGGININSNVSGMYAASLPQGAQENIVFIDNQTLITSFTSLSTLVTTATIAQRVYDYYQDRYIQKLKLFAHYAKVGESMLIDTLSGGQISAIVERTEIDLSNGFISDVTAVGDVI